MINIQNIITNIKILVKVTEDYDAPHIETPLIVMLVIDIFAALIILLSLLFWFINGFRIRVLFVIVVLNIVVYKTWVEKTAQKFKQ